MRPARKADKSAVLFEPHVKVQVQVKHSILLLVFMTCYVKALFLPLRAKKTMQEAQSVSLRKFVVLSVFLYLMLEMIVFGPQGFWMSL